MSNFSKFDATLLKTHKLEKLGRWVRLRVGQKNNPLPTVPTNPTYFFRVFIDISV